MAHLTLLESTVGFVLLMAGIYASLWGLWFLGVRFQPGWPIISRVGQPKRDRSKDRGSSSLNEYLKRRHYAQASGRCPSCGTALVVRIDSKGRFGKPEGPECSVEARRQSTLGRKQRLRHGRVLLILRVHRGDDLRRSVAPRGLDNLAKLRHQSGGTQQPPSG